MTDARILAGTGELIAAAIDAGATRIIVGLVDRLARTVESAPLKYLNRMAR